MNPAYAAGATAAFQLWMDGLLERIACRARDGLGDNLEALILGGGYGRGEGGLLRSKQGDRPFNDLDFFLVARRPRQAARWDSASALADLAAEAGIHLDISRPLTRRDLHRLPHSLMWHDLLLGHRVIAGPEGILESAAPPGLKDPLPPIEATRLLLNRGAGLLQSLRIAAGFEPLPDPEFLRRNFWKCALALGDALLILFQRYRPALRERRLEFEALDRKEPRVAALALVPWYRKALAFRMRPGLACRKEPDSEDLASMARKWEETFLLVEGLRLDRPWDAACAYVSWRGVRETAQHTPAKILRNLLLGLRSARPGWRYPREHLYRELPGLLVHNGMPRETWNLKGSRFLRTWNRFN